MYIGWCQYRLPPAAHHWQHSLQAAASMPSTQPFTADRPPAANADMQQMVARSEVHGGKRHCNHFNIKAQHACHHLHNHTIKPAHFVGMPVQLLHSHAFETHAAAAAAATSRTWQACLCSCCTLVCMPLLLPLLHATHLKVTFC
jgi:hypothetical protein